MTPAPKKKYPRRCVMPRCNGFITTPRAHSNKCPKCRWRIWVEKNPLKAAFKTLRNHAKERAKDFSLTFEQFKAFAIKTDYLKRKGKTSLSLQIDRVDNSKGYHIWNMQAITLRENTRKQFVPYFREYMERTQAETSAAISEAWMSYPPGT